jgi:hypothetical protein
MFLIVYDYFWFFSLSIFSQFFNYTELNTKKRKSVFCFIATLLSGLTTYSHYDILFLGAPNVTSNIIDLTNSYMRMYLLTDLVSVLRDTIIRKDMVFHHILMLYFFTNDFNVYRPVCRTGWTSCFLEFIILLPYTVTKYHFDKL